MTEIRNNMTTLAFKVEKKNKIFSKKNGNKGV